MVTGINVGKGDSMKDKIPGVKAIEKMTSL
jgi:hypothetical protein